MSNHLASFSTNHMGAYTGLTDLYRAKHGLPLEGEGAERFLASKPPVRWNKDYRARFRNFVFGYPIYKKDNYFRHWFNLQDILANNEAPLIKYTKLYLIAFVSSFVPLYLKDIPKMEDKTKLTKYKDFFINNKRHMSPNEPINSTRAFYMHYRGPAAALALLFTSWKMIHDYLKHSLDYSSKQSALRASFIVSPFIIFGLNDRLATNFWYKSAACAFTIYFSFVAAYMFLDRPRYDNYQRPSEKFYEKSVTEAEKAKIEFQDHIEAFAKDFDNNAMIRVYTNEQLNNVRLI